MFTANTTLRTVLCAAALFSAAVAHAQSNLKNVPQEGYGGPERYPDWDERSGVLITNQDWPGTVNKYYGQRRDQSEDSQRRIAKADIDADLNYDGVITND